MASSSYSTFYINVIDSNEPRVTRQYSIKSLEKILTFEISCSDPTNTSVEPFVVILAVEKNYGTELRWYKLEGEIFKEFWSWPINRPVKKLQLFEHELYNNYNYSNMRLLILIDALNSRNLHSVIEIYGFDIKSSLPEFW